MFSLQKSIKQKNVWERKVFVVWQKSQCCLVVWVFLQTAKICKGLKSISVSELSKFNDYNVYSPVHSTPIYKNYALFGLLMSLVCINTLKQVKQLKDIMLASKLIKFDNSFCSG